MGVAGEKYAPMFQGEGGDPDVVSGDRAALASEVDINFGVPLRGFRGYREDGDRGSAEELLETPGVFSLARTSAEPATEFAKDDHREEHRGGLTQYLKNSGIPPHKGRVGGGVEDGLHRCQSPG